MSVMEIPTEADESTGSFTITVDLDEIEFTFDFQFNSREGFWYFDVYDFEETLLKAGIKVVVESPLLLIYQEANLPPGDILAIDLTNSDKEARNLLDLGNDALLVYQEAS